MASDTSAYRIFYLNEQGRLVKMLDHTDGRATCAIDSIHIVQAMLQTDTVKSAFAQMAGEFGDEYPEVWFLQDQEGAREEKIENVVRKFLEKFLIPAFPNVFISDRLKHLDTTAVSHMFPYEDLFSISQQRVTLNGVKLQQMLNTKLRLGSAAGDEEEDIRDAYRMFKFQFAVTVLHEIGHLFTTYMGKGVNDTPPAPPQESGTRLEQLVFGDELHIYRDLRVGDSDCGAGSVIIKRRIGEDEFKYFEVELEAIDDTVDMNFQLPFKRDCVTLIKDEDPLDFLEEMQEGDEKEGETADPANHEQYWSRLDVLDPGWDARP